jgi:hypothetical protein
MKNVARVGDRSAASRALNASAEAIGAAQGRWSFRLRRTAAR